MLTDKQIQFLQDAQERFQRMLKTHPAVKDEAILWSMAKYQPCLARLADEQWSDGDLGEVDQDKFLGR